MTKATKSRLIAIGLDGATFDLVRPWVDQGKLPTFARLLQEGTSGVLQSVIPSLTMPAWSSFLTGLQPGHHGIYAFMRRKPDSYELTPFNGSYRKVTDISTVLNQQGRRVALVNVPSTYPAKPFDGFVITGLETPGRDSQFTYPESLKGELISRFDYEIERPEKYTPGQEKNFEAAVNRVESKRLDATLWLMDCDDWDFFAVVFRGTDVLGHAFWRFMDPSHPAHERQYVETFGNAILRHYQKMDQAIASIEAKLSPLDTLILMSDHGFGPMHRDVYSGNLLIENGLLCLKKTWKSNLRSMLVDLGLSPRNILNFLGKLRLENTIRRLVPQNARTAVNARMLMQTNVDWAHTKAYPLGGGGIICINLKGREPMGIVEPGTEYRRVCDDIEGVLRKLRDPATGQPVVKRVRRKEELYGDNHVADMPDLFIEWTNDAYTDMGGIGYARGLFSEPLRGRSGGHTERGLFLAKGPDIKKGHIIENARLIDLAPTMMHLLGAAVPRGLDGTVLLDIFKDQRKSEHVDYGVDNVLAAPQDGVHVQTFTNEEETIIEKRLKDLGYL